MVDETKVLAEHLVNLTFEDIPVSLVSDVKRLFLDWLGVALGGTTTESGRIAAEFARDIGEKADATVIGFGYKSSAPSVALANAILSHSLELDDCDIIPMVHFSPPVMGASLALAERERVDGRTFLTAAVAGCEVEARISHAVNPSHRDRGFHTTATAGTLGAAAAAGKILGLSKEEMVSCVGLACAQAGGLMEFYGPSMQKRFNPGPAASGGVVAAMFAKMGFTGTDTILEGPRGFCRAFSDKYDLGKITEKLGLEFPIYIEFKPYACARPIHSAIDCALNILRERKVSYEEIEEIMVRRHPAWADFHLSYDYETYHTAQTSLPYSVAVALVDGAAFIQQYSEQKIKDQRVLDLAKKVKITRDPTLPRGVSCAMNIRMKDGAEYESQVDYPKGSVQNPMTDAELKDKFRTLAQLRVSSNKAQKIINKVQSLDEVNDMAEVCSLLY